MLPKGKENKVSKSNQGFTFPKPDNKNKKEIRKTNLEKEKELE